MLHGTDGTLQAFLDDELRPDERAALVRHLDTCSACAAKLDGLRAAADQFSAAVQGLDQHAPAVAEAYAAVLHESRSRSSAAGKSGSRAAVAAVVAPRVARRAFLRAAALIVFCATAATGALVESPVRRWAVGVWTQVAAQLDDSASDSEGARDARAVSDPTGDREITPPGQTKPDPVGMSILPAGDRVRIMLERPAPQARVRIQLVDGPRAAIYVDGVETPEFRRGPDRIEVVGPGPGEIRVELPRTLAHAAVEVDGRVYVVKEGGALRVLSPTPETVGAEVVLPLP